MNQRSLARKVFALVAVFAFAGVTFWLIASPRVTCGTKTFFYASAAGGSAPAKTTTTTTADVSTTARP